MRMLMRYLAVYWLLMAAGQSRTKGSKSRDKRTVIGQFPVCPPGCASCSTINGCVTCIAGRYLFLHRDGLRQTGHCLHTCPAGYYPHRRNQLYVCQACSAPYCEVCFNQSYCTQCNVPYVPNRGKCIDACPNGTFYAAYTKECKEKVDCAADVWAAWETCTRNGATCGYKYGTQIRRRRQLQTPSPDGQVCPPLAEARNCKLLDRYCADLGENTSNLVLQNSIPQVDENTVARSKADKTRPKKKKRRKRKEKKRKRKCDKKCRRRRRRKRLRKKQKKHHQRRRLPLPSIKTNEIIPFPILS